MAKATTERNGLFDSLAKLMAGAQLPRDTRKNKVATGAVNQILVRSVCPNINPDTTTTSTWTQYRFDPLPTKCPQCRGPVVIEPMMAKDVLCHLEKV